MLIALPPRRGRASRPRSAGAALPACMVCLLWPDRFRVLTAEWIGPAGSQALVTPKALPLKLSHPGQQPESGSEPMAQDTGCGHGPRLPASDRRQPLGPVDQRGAVALCGRGYRSRPRPPTAPRARLPPQPGSARATSRRRARHLRRRRPRSRGSRSWLYTQPDIRADIERLRQPSRRAPGPAIPLASVPPAHLCTPGCRPRSNATACSPR